MRHDARLFERAVVAHVESIECHIGRGKNRRERTLRYRSRRQKKFSHRSTDWYPMTMKCLNNWVFRLLGNYDSGVAFVHLSTK